MAQASGGATLQSTIPGRQMDLYSQEEKQFLRISTLVLKTGTRALRSFFDTTLIPSMLQHELNFQNNKDKLQRLKSRRIIHAGQWDTLYPPIGGVVSSINFDITLMSLLLQEIGGINAPSTGWGTMPGGGDHSEGADIVRLRMYRNEMAHNNVGVLSNIEFQTKSTDIPQVIVRLGGTQFTTEINRILTCSIDETDMDLWREVRVELQEMKKEIAELNETDMELKNQEISPGKLKSWTEDGKTFYPTEATRLIYNEVKSKRNCISSGLPGAGKSANIHYIALLLKNEGHRLCCVQTFKELLFKMDRFGENEKQVYVIDDVFGVHGVDETKRKEWCDNNKDDLERCLNNKNVSILCSSRKQVIDDHKLSNIKSRFSIVNISEGKAVLSGDERAGILEKHAIARQRSNLLTENKDQLKTEIKEMVRQIKCPVGCFPLVCQLYTGEEEPQQTIEEYFRTALNATTDHLMLETDRACKFLEDNYKSYNPKTVPVIDIRTNNESAKILLLSEKVQEYREERIKGQIVVFKNPKHFKKEVNCQRDTICTLSESDKIRAENILDCNVNQLFEQHSNLVTASASSFKISDKDSEIVNGLHIVLYCVAKGFKPRNENRFPKVLKSATDELPVTVREGYFSHCGYEFLSGRLYHDKVKMGCGIEIQEHVNINCGSIGPFVMLDNLEFGFLTCCHVICENVDREYTYDISKNNERFTVLQPPATGNTRQNRRLGEVTRATYSANTENGGSVDAAIVRITESNRVPDQCGFAVCDQTNLSAAKLNELPLFRGIVDEQPNYTDDIVKFGMKTHATRGKIHLKKQQIRAGNIVFNGLYSIEPVSGIEPFSSEGDSGSGVFRTQRKEEREENLSLIGILIGNLDCNDSDYKSYVCPVRPVFQTLNLTYDNLKLESGKSCVSTLTRK